MSSNFWGISIRMVFIIVIAETLIMLLFSHLPLSSLNEFEYAMADSLLLGVLIVPAFYLFLILPVRKLTICEQEDRLLLHDSLTGLPQSALLLEMLEHEIHEAARDFSCISLVIVDPGGISDINQEMGFQTGDDVLIHIANAIQQACRSSDLVGHLDEAIVARLKGDAFVVLAPHADLAGSKIIEEKIRHAVDRPFNVDGITLNIVSTTGVAIYPDHAVKAENLVRCANAALAMAKQESIASVTYQETTASTAAQRIEVVSRLRHAIATNQFELFYQPKILLETGQATSAEALIRWMGKEGLSPAEFIPIAEHTGLISEITVWVVSEAVRQCKQWDNEGIAINIAVNVSARNLYEANFVELFVNMCRVQELDPGRITVEVTEGSVMTYPELAIERLKKLRDSGFRISLDDFGTGYSSLSYLKNIPAHELKLDQSFVANICNNISDERLVRAVIDLAQDMGISTVAEGVETEDVMLRLKEMGCDRVQGYFYSRPLDVASFEKWYRERLN